MHAARLVRERTAPSMHSLTTSRAAAGAFGAALARHGDGRGASVDDDGEGLLLRAADPDVRIKDAVGLQVRQSCGATDGRKANVGSGSAREFANHGWDAWAGSAVSTARRPLSVPRERTRGNHRGGQRDAGGSPCGGDCPVRFGVSYPRRFFSRATPRTGQCP